jgi:hypothetical protein
MNEALLETLRTAAQMFQGPENSFEDRLVSGCLFAITGASAEGRLLELSTAIFTFLRDRKSREGK